MMNNDTIAAIATPPGKGGVAILRISGSMSLNIAKKLSGKKEISPRKVLLCNISDRNNIHLDSGILLYFAAPNSFTGEDIVELQMHGSPVMMDAILQEVLHYGARLAQAGEFSQRAFLNDKIDLVQAEAIADLIDAHSVKAAQMASRSLQGEFSKRIFQINEKLIHLRLYVEASIDFPDEEIDVIGEGEVQRQLEVIIDDLNGVFAQASQGVLIREGLTLVIAGRPNAGKSTLINALAKQEIAIVTDIAGTTRDVMRAHVLLDDIPVHILDTAGLHESTDPVEQEGIKRAWKAIESADCVLHLVDGTLDDTQQTLNQELKKSLPRNIPILTVQNKMDLCTGELPDEADTINISAKTGQGLDTLIQKIKNISGYQPLEGLYLARRRHLNTLTKALQLLSSGQDQLIQHQALELLADDLRHAHDTLAEITGEFTSDDLLGKIFSSFCIGK